MSESGQKLTGRKDGARDYEFGNVGIKVIAEAVEGLAL